MKLSDPITFLPRSFMSTSILGMVLTTGCQMKVMQPTSDDQVRERVASLDEENRSLLETNQGLEARIEELTREQAPRTRALGAATPRLTSLRIASSSIVEAPEGASDRSMLVLRLAPRDDRGRFLQIVGGLEVRAVAVPDAGAPVLLASLAFDPLEVREAWRGGVMGSGYVFRLPLDHPASELPDTIDVVTIFSEGGTERVLRDEAPVRVSRGGTS